MHVFSAEPLSEAGFVQEPPILALEGQNKAKCHHAKPG